MPGLTITNQKPRNVAPFKIKFSFKNFDLTKRMDCTEGTNPKYAGLAVISGGQTGADRAGLDIARLMGISTGGWAAVDYMTSEGQDLSLKELGLKPITSATGVGYADRTRKNLEQANATLIFAFNRSSPGTRLTINHAVNKKLLYYVVDLGKDNLATEPQRVVAWLKNNSVLKSNFGGADLAAPINGEPFVLNVAGNREVHGTTKVYDATAAFMSAILHYWSTWEES